MDDPVCTKPVHLLRVKTFIELQSTINIPQNKLNKQIHIYVYNTTCNTDRPTVYRKFNSEYLTCSDQI